MSTAESRQKKFHPWPGTAFKSEASVPLPHRFSSSFVFPAESNAKRKREWRAPYGLRQQGNLQRAPKKYFVPQLRGFSRDLVAVFSVSLDTTMFGQTLTHWGGPCWFPHTKWMETKQKLICWPVTWLSISCVTRQILHVILSYFQECHVVREKRTEAIPSMDPLRHVRQPPLARKGRFRRRTSIAERMVWSEGEKSKCIEKLHLFRTPLNLGLTLVVGYSCKHALTFSLHAHSYSFSDRPVFLTRV